MKSYAVKLPSNRLNHMEVAEVYQDFQQAKYAAAFHRYTYRQQAEVWTLGENDEPTRCLKREMPAQQRYTI